MIELNLSKLFAWVELIIDAWIAALSIKITVTEFNNNEYVSGVLWIIISLCFVVVAIKHWIEQD